MLQDKGLHATESLVIPAIARANHLFRAEKPTLRNRSTRENAAPMGAVRHFSPTTPSRRNALENEVVSTQSADRPLHLVTGEHIVPRRSSEKIVRTMNVAIAAVALVLLIPVLFVVALVVWLTSKGPIIYTQVRVGEDRRSRSSASDHRRVYDHGGRLFRMYKFRTMRIDAEADGKAVWAQKSDPRTTSVGKFLRSTRLDELPQLVNVLKGDMNIVGPRPERPSIFAQLRNDIPQYAQRQLVKPGITGWAQINQAYDSCLDDVRNKVRYDLEYVRRRGVRHDLRIMSMTLPVMLLRTKGW
jgi:lipopolysaccharide/colanic/teichoic acid biosynthesis glycosyltransferase